MDNVDLSVLRSLCGWRTAGRHALLATVVRTWGSAPRPIGSIMALCESGAVVGSVSGGCIEDDLTYRYVRSVSDGTQGRIAAGPPTFLKYGVTAEEAHRFGLPCGGTLELLLEFDPDPASLDKLLEALGTGGLTRRIVCLATGSVRLEAANAVEELRVDESALANTFGPEFRMLLIGAGHLAEYLATMALFSGFAVTVCDPREEYRGQWSVHGATLVSQMPDDAVRDLRPDRRTCVVALTHDPKLDDLALMEALDSDAFYVGAIGSRRNNDARRRRMAEHFALSAVALRRLHGPVGIYIGSKTPAEIAVSIMAEVLAVKNGVFVPRDSAVAQMQGLHPS